MEGNGTLCTAGGERSTEQCGVVAFVWCGGYAAYMGLSHASDDVVPHYARHAHKVAELLLTLTWGWWGAWKTIIGRCGW